MENNDVTQAQVAETMTGWRRMAQAAKTLPMELIIGALAALVLGCALFGATGYAVGRNIAADEHLVVKKQQLDGEYRKIAAQVEKAKGEYQEQSDAYSQALNTISMADALEESVTELEQQKKDLEAQVKTVQDQLTSLQSKVGEARKNTIGDGVWQVGRDIDAGTYRANDSVGARCYWEIMVGDDIIQNDIPGGGYPQATVSDGQQLKLSRCGTWSKQ